MMRSTTRRVLLALSLAAATTACANGKGPAMLSTGVTGYNHTERSITFTVNNQAGDYLSPHTGGGSKSCCIGLPERWVPGTKVTVSWVMGKGTVMTDTEVEVPAYERDKVSSLNVHFLRGGTIKVFATMMDLRHRDYPLQGEEAQLKAGVPLKRFE